MQAQAILGAHVEQRQQEREEFPGTTVHGSSGLRVKSHSHALHALHSAIWPET